MNDDTEIVAGCLRGDARCWEVLFQREFDAVYGLLLGCVRDADLAQDLFEKLLPREMAALRRFDAGLGVSLGAYLRTIARNHFLDWNKSRVVKGQRSEVDLAPLESLLPDTTGPEEVLLERELLAHLERLSVRQKTAVKLRAEGLSYAEIAEVMGLTIGGLSALLARARESLERGMNEEDRPCRNT